MNLYCFLGLHDWSKNCESCANCDKQQKGAHIWQGCRCAMCGKTDHDWETDSKIRNCSKCSTEEYCSFERYLILTYGNLIPKRTFRLPFLDSPTIVHEVSDFLLNAGETERQRLINEYEQEREKFEESQPK